jgi:hypothetical protein
MSTNPTLIPPSPDAIAAYLAHRLNEEDAHAFEIYCLEHPDFAREVEQDLALKIGLQHLATAGASSTDPAAKSETLPALKSIPRRRRPHWSLAAAASIAILLAGALLLSRFNPRVPAIGFAQLPAALRQAPLAHATLIRTRGESLDTIALASADQVLELRIFPDVAVDPDTPITGDYSVRMSPAGAPPANSLLLDGLKPDADGYVHFYLKADAVGGGTWKIIVSSSHPRPGAPIPQPFKVSFVTAQAPPGSP